MPHARRFVHRPTRTAIAAAAIALVALPAAATNGMNLEAYGAKAGGMGGASFAHENGNSALMNNPATLGLRQEGSNLGLGLTVLMGMVASAHADGNQLLAWLKKMRPKWSRSGNTSSWLGRLAPPESTR